MSGIIPWHVEREPMISSRDILFVRALVYRLSICYTPICADQIFINWPSFAKPLLILHAKYEIFSHEIFSYLHVAKIQFDAVFLDVYLGTFGLTK